MYPKISTKKPFFEMDVVEFKIIYSLLFGKMERKRKTKRRLRNKKRKSFKIWN